MSESWMIVKCLFHIVYLGCISVKTIVPQHSGSHDDLGELMALGMEPQDQKENVP